MNSILEFKPFPKLARLSRTVTITEKLDGTNAQIVIDDLFKYQGEYGEKIPEGALTVGDFVIRAGYRNRWISAADDSYGFARWVAEHRGELCGLGVGQHFGEWWGNGIQRNYGVAEKRFSLFNTARWNQYTPPPHCCGVVPVLVVREFDTLHIGRTLHNLREFGSIAAPGFMQPEGIVIYHHASGQLFKKTCENDESPKSTIETI